MSEGVPDGKVLVGKYSQRRYHTNPDCPHGPEKDRYIDREKATEWYTECTYCKNGREHCSNDKRTGLRQLIQSGEVDPDDF